MQTHLRAGFHSQMITLVAVYRKEGRLLRMETGWPVTKFVRQLLPNHPTYLLKAQITKPHPSCKPTESEACGNKAKAAIFSWLSRRFSPAVRIRNHHPILHSDHLTGTHKTSSQHQIYALREMYVFFILPLCFNHISSTISNSARFSGSNFFHPKSNLGLILLLILPSFSLSLIFIFLFYKYYFLVFMHPFYCV